MNRDLRRWPARWRAAVVVAIAIVVVGCGTTNPASANPSTSVAPSASPSATESATPSPSPSPTPSPTVDLGKTFLAKLTAFDFSGKSTIAGELDVAAVRYGVSGRFDVSGTDSDTVVTIATPGGQADETIVAAGKNYHRTGSGPWFIVPPSTSGDLIAFLRTLKTVTDTGIESKAGQQLHHFTLPAGTTLSPTVLGLTDPTITGATGSAEFWAKDDGTIGVMAVTAAWKQGAALVDVTMTVEFTFSEVGTKVAILAPEQTWTSYASKINHVAIAYPSDWDLYKAARAGKFDEFDGPIYAYALIGRYAAKGVNLNALVKYLAAHKPSYASAYHVDKITTITLGGVSARELLVRATVKGTKQYWVVYITLKGGYFTEFDLIDKAGHEADTRALAAQFLSTIVLK